MGYVLKLPQLNSFDEVLFSWNNDLGYPAFYIVFVGNAICQHDIHWL
jgi:hypothetical protein